MRNYRAFISYNHGDERIARKLHRRIESFRPSKRLKPTPRRIQPVFRDREELAAATDLPDKLTAALQYSENLIVLCSPRAAASEWVNREVATFADMHGPDRIFPVIVGGEAPACFPPCPATCALWRDEEPRGCPRPLPLVAIDGLMAA